MSDTDTGETATETRRIVDSLKNGSLSSRRSFLQKSAALGGGALVLALGGSSEALAHDADDDDTSDVDVLNFALTLEHLEYAFYRDLLEEFDEKDFRRAKTLNGFGNRTREDVRPNLVDVRDHEKAHVDTLTEIIEDLGGDPVEEACYDFGVDDVDDFLAIAAVLENTGVSAYDGAISLIEDAELLTAGATIATVEARHASYLNFLTDADPFPESFDPTRTKQEVLDAAGGFIVDCDASDSDQPFDVAVDCDVSNPAKVTVTNVSERRVELRDIDGKGVDAVDGRPVLDPGESYTKRGVPSGTAVLVAFEPGSNERLSDETRAEIRCG
ncbi:ferritin-like domain-containing protein [Salinigranum salinum]|uniref:ferritin-like domain-containing protein n=1 Tax=Salinigranum salinum TaxID=1364937 RepID=UPI0012605039|nr:ferritin-like domain-containing protein [Salinigranum salinum]